MRNSQMKVLCFLFYFFFFQAEDGIRDRDVTGVQTCALPTSEVTASKALFICYLLGLLKQKGAQKGPLYSTG